MTYICLFFVLNWLAPFLKFGPLPSENPRCAADVSIVNEIKTYFKFVLLKSQIKIRLSAVGNTYCTCALLQNARTCLYSNQISEYFQLDPTLLENYYQ